ncbi:MAG: hypothetical protein HC808_17185 [Candidatus Competibacteraceae bacterium]|nr:hypothetical protein [Candidatus Competibacteraceae bacterium]
MDVAGGTDSNPEVFADCARAILQDENVDALLIVGLFGGYKLRFSATLELLENQTAARLGNLVNEFGKPVLLQSIYEPMRTEALVTLREFGVPVHYSMKPLCSVWLHWRTTALPNCVTHRLNRHRLKNPHPRLSPLCTLAANSDVSACWNMKPSNYSVFTVLPCRPRCWSARPVS